MRKIKQRAKKRAKQQRAIPLYGRLLLRWGSLSSARRRMARARKSGPLPFWPDEPAGIILGDLR